MVAALEAINLVMTLVTTATNALNTANQVSALIQKAATEKRDITIDEFKSIVALDDAARKLLVDAIARAGG